MKLQPFLFLLFTCVFSSLNGQNNTFKASAQLLSNDDPNDAISLMDSILAQGKSSPELYSNLGHAHYLKGNMADAILYYEKALLLDPTNQDILKSITAIRKTLDIQVTDIPDFILLSFYRTTVNLCSSTTWTVLQLMMGMIAVAFLFLFLFPKQNINLSQKAVNLIGIGALVLSCLFFLFSYSKKGYELGKNAGIITESKISLHQAPDKLSPEVTPIGAGNKVFIISELGEWYKVSLRDKDTGWVQKEEVAII